MCDVKERRSRSIVFQAGCGIARQPLHRIDLFGPLVLWVKPGKWVDRRKQVWIAYVGWI
jgi:hypothetical protein